MHMIIFRLSLFIAQSTIASSGNLFNGIFFLLAIGALEAVEFQEYDW